MYVERQTEGNYSWWEIWETQLRGSGKLDKHVLLHRNESIAAGGQRCATNRFFVADSRQGILRKTAAQRSAVGDTALLAAAVTVEDRASGMAAVAASEWSTVSAASKWREVDDKELPRMCMVAALLASRAKKRPVELPPGRHQRQKPPLVPWEQFRAAGSPLAQSLG